MYLQLVSIHGLIRPHNIEMGRDADTGGQIRYVLELAKSLSEHPDVDAVDLFTRRIKDQRVDPCYAEPIEPLGPKCRLVRLPCGGNRYIPKEKLWPHLDEYVDAMIAFTRSEGRSPDLVHGHYADAGYVSKEVAAAFGSPFVFTAHSLGKSKLEYLIEEGWTLEQANKTLAIEHRISVEQDCLGVSDLIVTSTRHEKSSQWGLYPSRPDVNFKVIPPGTDLDRFFPYYDYDLSSETIDERFKQARVRMQGELGRFHFEQDKPLILALCRPDRRKNIGALIEAYGRSSQLRAIANLVILAGIRENIEEMPENERVVLTDMLLAMDRYNLYGKMAIPKNHDSEFDVPELYRLAAASGGVFVNTAFTELFGLTAIEASAVGLPFVLTENGGPQDIAANCESGLLVNVNDHAAITDAMLKVLTHRSDWERMSSNGINKVREHYSWATHADRFVEEIKPLVAARAATTAVDEPPAVGKRLASIEKLLITDIDNTLLGDDEALRSLCEVLAEHRDRIGFGVASGRSIELTREALAHAGIDRIDVAVCSVGAEIYYGADFVADRGWASRLRARWQREKIEDALSSLSFLTLQERDFAQREFKISYDLDCQVNKGTALRKVREVLATTKSSYSLVFSHGTFFDVLPHRASKGKAVRYLADKWRLGIEDIATAGDSGNDLDMLQGRTAGIVVGNHDAELAPLRQQKSARIYFADGNNAAGILEGLRHYSFV